MRVDGGAEERQEREVQLTFPEPGAWSERPHRRGTKAGAERTAGAQETEAGAETEGKPVQYRAVRQPEATREAACRQEGRESAHTRPLLATGSTAKQGERLQVEGR